MRIGLLLLIVMLWPGEVSAIIYYVDTQHASASDSNPGTAPTLPLKTISAAVTKAIANNVVNTATQILIAAGTYRESLSLPASGSTTDAPISIEAITLGSVVVSGSDVYTGWTSVPSTAKFTHAWPHNFGLAPYPPGWVSLGITLADIVRRREMFFVNGTHLTQVLTAGAVVEGTFFVDEAADLVTIWPPAGTNMGTALIEAAVRSGLFNAVSRNNLTVRGIIFQHDTTPVQGSAVILDGGTGDVFEDNQFIWNNWGGFSRSLGETTTLRRNIASDNGGIGIGSFKTIDLLMEENETSRNNWRGFQGGFTGFAVSGMKILHLHSGTIRKHRAIGNFTNGMWFDTGCTDLVIDQAFIDANLEHGLFIEANQGPIALTNSIICHNQDTGAILLANSTDVTLTNNILYGNTDQQIIVSGTDTPRSVTDWETNQVYALSTERTTMQFNKIVGLGTATPGPLVLSTTLSTAWPTFTSTLNSDCNIWWNPNRTNVWQVAGAVLVDFAGWKTATGDEANSLFADPKFTDPSIHDFRLLSGAPVVNCPTTGSPARVIPLASMSIPAGGAVSEENATPGGYVAANAIDGNPRTYWHTEFSPSAVPVAPNGCTVAPYCFIVIRLSQNYSTNKLIYWPGLATLAGGATLTTGRVGNYHVLITTDPACSTGWTEVATGNWADTSDTKRAVWNATPTRCVKLENRLSANGTNLHMHAAEIVLFEAAAPVADSPGVGADTDFNTRCHAPGVTVCYGFDDPFTGVGATHVKDANGVDYGANLRKSRGGVGTQIPTRDTTYKTSGAASLRFTAPPPPHDGADIAGQFLLEPANQSVAGVGQQFGPNETFYVQFRYRKSNETMFNSWGIAMKHMVLYSAPVPCDTNTPGLVLVNWQSSSIVQGYSQCGAEPWYTTSDLVTWRGNRAVPGQVNTPPLWMQQGAMNCQYGTWANCLYDKPDAWRTYYCKFGVATFGSTGHTVECWFAEQGATAYTKFLNVQSGFPLGTVLSDGFDSVSFEMYMTGLVADNPTAGDASVTSIINVDEVIFSSQPIALPTLPSLRVQVGGAGGLGGRVRIQ